MATRKRRSSGTKKRRAVVVVGRRRRSTSHHKPARRRVSGISGTAVGRTRHRRRRSSSVGSIKSANVKQIAMMAVGVGVGAFGTHIILRPIEKKLVEKWPVLGKVMAAGEVFLGGLIALKGKHTFTKSVGVGILAGGVHGLMQQFKIGGGIPGIHGMDDYSTVRIPISGDVESMVSGILKDGRSTVRTPYVAETSGDMGQSVATDSIPYYVKM